MTFYVDNNKISSIIEPFQKEFDYVAVQSNLYIFLFIFIYFSAEGKLH